MTVPVNSESPCINVCTLDSATQMCVGCFRTIDEITSWMTFSDQRRAGVNGELPARRAAYQRRRSDPLSKQSESPNQHCQQCGEAFECGISKPEDACWCARLPNVVRPSDNNATCLCPACLRKLIETR